MLRAQVAAGTELGREAKRYMDAGELVPDEVIVGMITKRVRAPRRRATASCSTASRATPSRPTRWPTALDELGRRLSGALLIEVPDDELVRRLAGRRVCVKNPSHIYHVEFDPPKHEGICDQDGSRLVQRDDDKEETIRRRLEVYHSQTEPLIELLRRAPACCAVSTARAIPTRCTRGSARRSRRCGSRRSCSRAARPREARRGS